MPGMVRARLGAAGRSAGLGPAVSPSPSPGGSGGPGRSPFRISVCWKVRVFLPTCSAGRTRVVPVRLTFSSLNQARRPRGWTRLVGQARVTRPPSDAGSGLSPPRPRGFKCSGGSCKETPSPFPEGVGMRARGPGRGTERWQPRRRLRIRRDETVWCPRTSRPQPQGQARGQRDTEASAFARTPPGLSRGGQQSIEPSAGPPEPGPRGRRPPPSKPRGAEGPSVSFQRNNFVCLRRIRRCLSPPRLRPRHPGHAPWSPSARCSGQKATDSAHLRQQDTDGLAEPKTSFQRRKDLDVSRLWVAGCFCC